MNHIESKKHNTDESSSLDQTSRKRQGFVLAASQIGLECYLFLVVCVAAQLATVLITWPIWEVRAERVVLEPASTQAQNALLDNEEQNLVPEFALINFPWIEGTPQFPCGALMIASLVIVLISPRKLGMAMHLAVLLAAILMDQLRCQPQILSITFLMAACVWRPARILCVWYLVSMWFWAGFHKLISDEWFGNNSVELLMMLNFVHPHENYWGFAMAVALSELVLVAIAITWPRIGGVLGALLHIGIAIFMSIIHWNYSVIPWNLCTAIVGAWLFFRVIPAQLSEESAESPAARRLVDRTGRLKLPRTRALGLASLALLVIPVGVYFGWVRHCFAHVLYSGDLPIAAITRSDGSIEQLRGWGIYGVPFPHEGKAYKDYFRLSGKSGEKLHIFDRRKFVAGGFYEIADDGMIKELTEEQFFSLGKLFTSGIACDDREKLLALQIAGVRLLKRSRFDMIYAVAFNKDQFSSEQMEALTGLKNVEQVQLEQCPVTNADLIKLRQLPKLVGIGINETPITKEGLKQLTGLPNLTIVQFKGRTYSSVEEILSE